MDDYVRCSLPCSCLRWRILLVPQNDTQRNFLFFFCFSRFEYCIRRIYILDSKNIYIIHHALECTFRMGQRVFSNCISPWLKRMAKRCHRVGITPIYFSPVWQERSSYRLIKRREHRLRCSRLYYARFCCSACCFPLGVFSFPVLTLKERLYLREQDAGQGFCLVIGNPCAVVVGLLSARHSITPS